MQKFLALLIVAGIIALFVVNVTCDRCQASGKIENVVHLTCKRCDGTGRTTWKMKKQRGGTKSLGKTPACAFCKGKGFKTKVKADIIDCPECEGSGEITLYTLIVDSVRENFSGPKDATEEASASKLSDENRIDSRK